ncbi:MAG: ABC transporter ATP-binding protein [Acetobacteraceae bacterium]|nr:ABC transporter ATP-binding protein [Acetobacteraceae bacterium]
MLELRDVHKTYETDKGKRHVLKGVTATFQKGDAVGILGRNGAGKSTLMRIIGGVDHPTSGTIRRRMSVSWPLGFGGAVHPLLTGADNCRFIARIYDRPLDWVTGFVQEFAELGDYFHLPVKTYSSGMETRLAFALSLAVDFDCYLVDEVVAVGDHRFAQRCREALLERRGRSTLLLVSHQPDIVRSLCTSAATLDQGRLTFHEDLDQAVAAYHAL